METSFDVVLSHNEEMQKSEPETFGKCGAS